MIVDPFDVQVGDRITIAGPYVEGKPTTIPAVVVRWGDMSHPLPAVWVQPDGFDYEWFVSLWRADLVYPLRSGKVEVTRQGGCEQ